MDTLGVAGERGWSVCWRFLVDAMPMLCRSAGVNGEHFRLSTRMRRGGPLYEE